MLATMERSVSSDNRTSVSSDPKKEVDATIDFLYTVVKGHWIACACEILGITDVDGPIKYPQGIFTADLREFVEEIATKVVDRLTLVDSAFIVPGETSDSGDTCYNYSRALCHCSMEFRDARGQGDGERFDAGCHIFKQLASLAALSVLFQTNATLSPNAAHQVMWHRFVNSEWATIYINKQVKYIIQNMGPEASLQRAARSVSTLLYMQLAVWCSTWYSYAFNPTRHTKVVSTVLSNLPRKHSAFQKLHLDPLHKWDVHKTLN